MTERMDRRRTELLALPLSDRFFAPVDMVQAIFDARNVLNVESERSPSEDLLVKNLTQARRIAKIKLGEAWVERRSAGKLRGTFYDADHVTVILGEFSEIVTANSTIFGRVGVTGEVLAKAKEILFAEETEKRKSFIELLSRDGMASHILMLTRDLAESSGERLPKQNTLTRINELSGALRRDVDSFKQSNPARARQSEAFVDSVLIPLSQPEDEKEAIERAKIFFDESGPMRNWVKKSRITPEAAVLARLVFRQDTESLEALDNLLSSTHPKGKAHQFKASEMWEALFNYEVLGIPLENSIPVK